jgi:hypothetical protein
LADANSFLNIKLKMLEQELIDKQEQVDQLKDMNKKQAMKFSQQFY